MVYPSGDPSPAPRPATRYFDLLPNEILSSIVEALASLDLERHGRYYHSTGLDLSSLCLTSKHLQAIAKPILYRKIDFTFFSYRFPQTNSQLCQLVRTFFLRQIDHDYYSDEEQGSEAERDLVESESAIIGRRAAKSFTNLESLFCSAVRSEAIEPFFGTNIKRLYLSGCQVNERVNFYFPCLENLSLNCCEFEGVIEIDPEDPTIFTLPKLRHLSLSRWIRSHSSDVPYSFKELVNGFYDQLVSITLEAQYLDILPAHDLSKKGPYLVADAQRFKPNLPPNVAHLVHGIRFRVEEGTWLNKGTWLNTRNLLGHVGRILNESSTNSSAFPLETFYCPTYLNPTYETSRIRKETLEFMEKCSKFNIDMSFEEERFEPQRLYDENISPEVVRRSEERWRRLQKGAERGREI